MKLYCIECDVCNKKTMEISKKTEISLGRISKHQFEKKLDSDLALINYGCSRKEVRLKDGVNINDVFDILESEDE